MKCKVCGAESGKYPLCRICYIKKEKGEIIKCDKCNNWHYANSFCPAPNPTPSNKYLYNAKTTLISKSEQAFYHAIKASVPTGYNVFPQINLAAFIEKTDNSRFHNELFRNVDFLVTDANYCPKLIVEINDQSHLNTDRQERDQKVQKICEEAGIPILKLWTSYGINTEYIKDKITNSINSLPVTRIHHFMQDTPIQPVPHSTQTPLSTQVQHGTSYYQSGCYIATCVYGSYDCPEVWVLRRFRDSFLSTVWYGRIFIKVYYSVSPVLVKLFGKQNWFKNICKPILDKIVKKLRINGVNDTPYAD